MLNALLVAAVLLLGQGTEPTGIIAGTVVLPASQKISGPVQVVLLSPRYSDLWSSDLQKRLDVYWERYKPAFARQKEFFFEVSKQAHRETTNYVITRMRRDTSSNFSNYLKETTPDGKFEFKNVPYGEYKILAVGRIGDQEVIWQEAVDVRSPIPQFLELNKRIP
jgi:hypothetical protein